MANPDNAASEDFGTKVNSVISNVTRDADGKLKFPEDTSPEIEFAARAELRRRDTQAKYTRVAQEKAALSAERTELYDQLSKRVAPELTPEQQSELDELKDTDVDAWHSKLRSYETQAEAKARAKIDEQLKEVSAKGVVAAQLEQRKVILADFLTAHPGFTIDDDIIANDIPPRITKKLEAGTISFEAFLQEAYNYLNQGKVVAGAETTMNQPNLSKAGGGSSPSDDAVGRDSANSYNDEIY